MKRPLNNDQTLFERLRLEPILAAVGISFFIQLQPMFFWGGESIVNVSWFINAFLTASLAVWLAGWSSRRRKDGGE
jgi:hypothetical protein